MEPLIVATKKRVDPLVGTNSVIDTETTGVNLRTDRVISFGHVRLQDGKIIDSIEWFFNPGDTEIHPDALRVHGITKEFLADKPPIKGYLVKIIELMVDAIVCGHNVKFDIDMINAELARHRYPPLEKFILDKFDTMLESRERWPGKPANLDTLCARVGVSTAHRKKHGALTDAMLCAEALVAMHREQRSFDELFAGAGTAVARNDEATAFAPVLVVRATAEEVAAHDAYLDGMGDTPIWRTCATPPQQDDVEQGEELHEAESAMAPA